MPDATPTNAAANVKFTLSERAARFGFCVRPSQTFTHPVHAKPRSHDDGVRNGPFMGGLGNPMFSRSIDGDFDRWQLEPGVHLHEALDPAFLAVQWVENGRTHLRKLRVGLGERDLDESHRQYQALFPVVFEH